MPLQLDIITPEKKAFSGTVENVYLPGSDGEMGVLPMHAGLVTGLQAGELRYVHEGKSVTMAVGSGFAEVSQTHVTVLTDMALEEAQIDIQMEEAAIARAQEKLLTLDHSTNSEEVAFLEGLISRSTAAVSFKRKYQR